MADDSFEIPFTVTTGELVAAIRHKRGITIPADDVIRMAATALDNMTEAEKIKFLHAVSEQPRADES